mgnify:FL=1|jgi:hypothetical protein
MIDKKINLIRKMRVELDQITTDCFDKQYPSYISNNLTTVLSILDKTITNLSEHKKGGNHDN